MPLRTPEKKSPLSGEGRLFSSSAAESDGVENFDSRLAVGRRVSLSAMITHAGGDVEADLWERVEDIASSNPSYIVLGGEERGRLTTERASSNERSRALSRLKTCCVRMFGEICSSKVSSVIVSPFVVANLTPGWGGARES
jgi:hypothetical protein